MGLYTPTILGGNSYLSWFYETGAIKDPAHTGTSKGCKKGPIRKILPNYILLFFLSRITIQTLQSGTYANVYVTIHSHGLSAGVQTHYVTANGVRNGLGSGELLGRGGRGGRLATRIDKALMVLAVASPMFVTVSSVLL